MKIKPLYTRLKSVEIREVPYRIHQLIRAFILDPISIFTRKYKPNTTHLRNIEFHDQTAGIDSHDSGLAIGLLQLEIENALDIKYWRRDYRSQIDSQLKYYVFIDKQNFSEYGDIKYVWELSRFYHLPILAVTAVRNQDATLAKRIQDQIVEWMDQNPYLMSINWKSGIEIGIRMINWSIAISFLNKNGYLSDNFKELYQKSVYEHAYYLRHHLSRYSSANNHLIAELVGLMFAGHQLGNKTGDQWFKYALDELVSQVENQFSSDGGNREQAVHYHALTLDLYQMANSLLKSRGDILSDNVKSRLQAAGEFLTAYFENMGGSIEFGDSDSSYVICNPFDRNQHHYESVMLTSSIEFEGERNAFAEEWGIDFRNQLLYPNKQLRELDTRKSNGEGAFKFKHYKESGYLIIDHKETKLIYDVGFLGMGTMAAHGHSDALHITLAIDKQPILIDPGTYQYHHKYEKWRNYFRSTSAHNTISINSMNQAEVLGRMNWGKRYDVDVEEIVDSENQFVATASHNGFIKQNNDVLHRRKIIIDKKRDEIVLLDELVGKDRYQYDFHLHFDPSISTIELQSNQLFIRACDINMMIENDEFVNAKIHYADDVTPLGWYSPRFDSLIPTHTLKLQGTGIDKHVLKSRIFRL